LIQCQYCSSPLAHAFITFFLLPAPGKKSERERFRLVENIFFILSLSTCMLLLLLLALTEMRNIERSREFEERKKGVFYLCSCFDGAIELD
jgi:hypothetical protein